jgi:hypothetical protein
MATEIIYSAGIQANEPMFGKFLHPIKALIENESNNLEKQKTILDVLYNVETSNRYAETVMGESDFATFASKEEGAAAEKDTVQKTFDKTIEHIEFAKEFVITRKMADDAKFGIGANIKSKPKKFVRAYYKTKVDIAAKALINGKNATMTYSNSTVDLKTGDGKPLFSNAHPYALASMGSKTQSNLFFGDITSDETKFETALNMLSNKVRNFKDENGAVMGYVADILIIPCNRPKLEMMAKRLCGSELTPSTGNNAINTQYGNWTLVVLDGWETEADEIMVMSSEANENLLANMFFNRVPLDITNDVDKHTRNFFWNGYCRFGVGFTTWKHIARCSHSTTDVTGATKLA